MRTFSGDLPIFLFFVTVVVGFSFLDRKRSVADRKEISLKRKKAIENRINSLRDTLAFIDAKTALYDRFLFGETEYYSYLVKKQ